MSDSTQVHTDEDGIPLLENAIPHERLQQAPPAAGADLTDQEQVEALLQHEDVQTLLGDLSEDLRKLIAWKMEEVMKEELQKLIHDATERTIPRLQEDIHTHLSLALPELMAKIAEQGRR